MARTEAIRQGYTSQEDMDTFVRYQLRAFFGTSAPNVNALSSNPYTKKDQSSLFGDDSMEIDKLSTILSEGDGSE